MGALGVNFTTFKEQEKRVEEYRRRVQNCTPAGAVVNDKLATANFLYCHEDSAAGVGTGLRMIGTFQYLAGQLDMAKEAWPTKGYPSPGLLAGARRAASSPAEAGEPPEGIAIGNPDQVIRELKKWEATGVDLVNFILNAHEQIPQEQVLESLRVFGREVMPAFKD
jgi:alkanesulfonate monooxygenase SsuD/methylene tetrahydromethanopterin reductase-like flavin-dependent oxidoreductase (luciferase family)